jgi:hypothetical protein
MKFNQGHEKTRQLVVRKNKSAVGNLYQSIPVTAKGKSINDSTLDGLRSAYR